MLYGHEFDRLTHAMSTRNALREHVWLIGENELVTQRSYYQLAPGLMDNHQKALFVGFHARWRVHIISLRHSASNLEQVSTHHLAPALAATRDPRA